jgi:hypothetical protein
VQGWEVMYILADCGGVTQSHGLTSQTCFVMNRRIFGHVREKVTGEWKQLKRKVL